MSNMNAVEAKNLSDKAKKELDLEPIFVEIKSAASMGTQAFVSEAI